MTLEEAIIQHKPDANEFLKYMSRKERGDLDEQQ